MDTSVTSKFDIGGLILTQQMIHISGMLASFVDFFTIDMEYSVLKEKFDIEKENVPLFLVLSLLCGQLCCGLLASTAAQEIVEDGYWLMSPFPI